VPPLDSPWVLLLAWFSFFFFCVFPGAESSLTTEYAYLLVFMGGFSVVVFTFLASVDGFGPAGIKSATFSTIAFILGAATSTVSGYLGMKIATCKQAPCTLLKGTLMHAVVTLQAMRALGEAQGTPEGKLRL